MSWLGILLMENEFWLNRWKTDQIGWHQTDVEPQLTAHFSHLKPTHVFVPFCGKSLDLKWLASQGHQVVGVELSKKACLSFFVENNIAYQVISRDRFARYSGGGVTLLNGDFFDLHKEDLPAIGAVYDRAALIALPR